MSDLWFTGDKNIDIGFLPGLLSHSKHSLQESEGIEQDADVVCFLYRDEHYHPDSDKKGITEVITAKNSGGDVGKTELLFIKNTPDLRVLQYRHRLIHEATTINIGGSTMKAINQQLTELYQNLIGNPSAPPPGVDKDLSSPLFIKFADDRKVESADLRVMFFGQETLGWEKGSIDDVMEVYRIFFNDFNEYPQAPEGHCWQKQKLSSPFWRVLDQMKAEIGGRLPGKQISYIWNNVVKACYKGYKLPSGVYAAFRDVNRKLILGEIEIIKPDVMVFFTGGRSSDHKIDDVFNNGEGFDKEVIEIDGNTDVFAKAPLPIFGDAYISYHPRRLSRKNREFIINAIAEQCTKVLQKP